MQQQKMRSIYLYNELLQQEMIKDSITILMVSVNEKIYLKKIVYVFVYDINNQ